MMVGRLLRIGVLVCCLALLIACQPIQPPVAVTPDESVPPTQPWRALHHPDTGELQLALNDGEPISVFPAGSNVSELTWSPDGTHLIVLREGRSVDAQGQLVRSEEPTALWQIELFPTAASEPQLVFATQATEEYEEGIVLGDWSPDGRYLLFWTDPYYSASLLADGAPLWMLDTATATAHLVSGQPPLSDESVLLNSRYHSWSPDSSRLAITVGGYRSALIHKWLVIHEPASQQNTVIITSTEQIPGIVAWSPTGDLIAYAAVPATETSDEFADGTSWENPAIAGRRVYLLDPNSGEHWRLNDEETFQDAPLWSEDGRTLYYVQRNGDLLNLMAADPETGEATVVEGAARPAGDSLEGYYGQSDFADLLAQRPAAP